MSEDKFIYTYSAIKDEMPKEDKKALAEEEINLDKKIKDSYEIKKNKRKDG